MRQTPRKSWKNQALSRGLGCAMILTAALVTTEGHANPWTRGQGSYYLNLSYSTLGASGYYGPGGEKRSIGAAYRQQSVGFYGEVGIIDRWLTGVIDGTPYLHNALDGYGTVQGPGDLRVGVRSGILVAPLRVTAGVQVGVPTGDPDPDVAGAAGAGPLAASLLTGDGEPDVELTLGLGKAFGGRGTGWPLQHYAIAEVGYWLRTESRAATVAGPDGASLADAVNWRLEIGVKAPWQVLERFWLSARVFGSESLAAGGEGPVGFSGLGHGVTHRSYAVGLSGRLWRGLSLSASAAGAWHAEGIAAGAQYRVGLSWEG